MKEIVVDVLLGLGVLFVVLSALGVLAMRSAVDRLHFTAPAATFSPICFAAAVLVEEPLSSAGVKAVLVALVLGLTSPVLGHATVRAFRIREEGRWKVRPHELKHPEEYR